MVKSIEIYINKTKMLRMFQVGSTTYFYNLYICKTNVNVKCTFNNKSNVKNHHTVCKMQKLKNILLIITIQYYDVLKLFNKRFKPKQQK